jgi:hypothetical protein
VVGRHAGSCPAASGLSIQGERLALPADELTLDGEKILVFDDLRIDKGGQIAKFGA